MGTAGADSTVAGPTGAMGADGADGTDGTDGTTGATGAMGTAGTDGTDGALANPFAVKTLLADSANIAGTSWNNSNLNTAHSINEGAFTVTAGSIAVPEGGLYEVSMSVQIHTDAGVVKELL